MICVKWYSFFEKIIIFSSFFEFAQKKIAFA